MMMVDDAPSFHLYKQI